MKATSKKAQNFINNYLRSDNYELWHVYGSYSREKERSYEHIRSEMYEEGGKGLRITSHNSQVYTCAYILGNDLIYHTPYYRYVIENWESGC